MTRHVQPPAEQPQEMDLIDLSDEPEYPVLASGHEHDADVDEGSDESDSTVEDGALTKAEDNFQPSETMAIAVMGVTGSGKSSFISLLADQHVEVGHSLRSSTVHIGMYSLTYPGTNKTIILLDTPGFDDTNRSDTDILKEIAGFMSLMYTRQVRLAGIIYLHRITDPRIGGSTLKNLEMFQKLCGTASLPSVCLATTMWGDLDPTEAGQRIGHKRQEELQKLFWGGMIAAGSKVAVHDGERGSALGIVEQLVRENANVVLDIVRELVEEGKTLDETAAGMYLQSELVEARKKFESDLAELQESMEEAIKEKDEETIRAIKKEKEAAEARAAQHAQEWEALKISMEQLTQDEMPKYRHLAREKTQQQQQQSTAVVAVPRGADAAAREKAQRELEGRLKEKERQFKEYMARQEVSQLQQNHAQLQQIRHLREEMSQLRCQLDRRQESPRSNGFIRALRHMFDWTTPYYVPEQRPRLPPPPPPRRVRPDYHHHHQSRGRW